METDLPTLGRPAPLVAAILILVGLLLLVGGGRLLIVGGSAYYIFAGAALVISGGLMWCGRALGRDWFNGFLVATSIWALIEVGLNCWALLPRLGMFALLALLVWTRPGLAPTRGRSKRIAEAIGLLLLIATIISVTVGKPPDSGRIVNPTQDEAPISAAGDADWPNYGNALYGSRFSPSGQINAQNVSRLEVAWEFRSGDLLGPKDVHPLSGALTNEATPLKVGNALYSCTPRSRVFALDAETGRELWRFDPKTDVRDTLNATCRGVAYFHATNLAGRTCEDRLLFGTVDARLLAIDANTGRRCADFGQDGEVSLLEGLGHVIKGYYYLTSPPIIIHGRAVIGGWVRDNQSTNEPSGVVRAFDTITGRLTWAWDMGSPGVANPPALGENYTRSTPNSWGVASADEKLGLVYLPTGNPTPDFFGGQRRPFDEKYGSSVVALDADTGTVKWSFQTVHHDLWDYDVGSQPVLVDLPSANETTFALIEPTKSGELFLLDRANGKPLARVIEMPVPQGAVEGERLSKTQPFSVDIPNVRGAPLSEKDMWGLTPFDQLICRIRYRKSKYAGIFTPPGSEDTIYDPGMTGGVNWGSAAIDDDRKILIVNSTHMPFIMRLERREKILTAQTAKSRQNVDAGLYWSMQDGTPYVVHAEPFMSPAKLPCVRPPWGTLTAIDLKTRKRLWQQPLGSTEDQGPMGVPSRLPLNIGTPNVGGSLVTRGGLIFIAASMDQNIRAFDIVTGHEVWKHRLPAGGQATPMSYISTKSGRQFVVITAGGHASLGTKEGDYTIAFALPAKEAAQGPANSRPR
jgi:membrane-bound PQQ-dependent dehydrogenase (glucose/quinate/shikimate family)